MENITGFVQKGNVGHDVKLVQEWLCLHDFRVGIDGDFGPATDKALRMFQESENIVIDGVVGPYTWHRLVSPMMKALTPIEPQGMNLTKLIVAYAEQHLRAHPREVGGQNQGPWVRLYCRGRDGTPWAWCCGFVYFIYQQACETIGVKTTLDYTLSCDNLAQQAKTKKIFYDGAVTRPNPGDFFLNQRSTYDWTHTGIIIKAEKTYIETIEGNTNDEGSREGYEVCKRTRGYSTNRDFVLINKLHERYYG